MDGNGSGQRWVCSWIAYVQGFGATNPGRVHLPGGGTERSDDSNQVQSGATITYTPNPGFGYYTRTLPDGTVQIFDLVAEGYRFLMTKSIDPQGNIVRYKYCQQTDCSDFNSHQARLLSVTDALGQETTISYYSNTPGNPDYFLIERITDPFGRYAWFEYNNADQLWKVHDTIGIVSEFLYEDATDANFITALITPYKRTDFSHPSSDLQLPGDPEDNARIIQAEDAVTHAIERAEFGHAAPGIDAEEGSDLPNVPGVNIADGLYDTRNSFYWDKKASAGGGVNDYTRAKLIHWLHHDYDPINGPTVSNIKEREKMPLENAVYYFYAGQAETHGEGTAGSPSIVARVLGDGTTQLTQYEYSPTQHKLTKSIDPANRTTFHQYDANNGIDLIAVYQANPDGDSVYAGQPVDQIFSATYNSFHQPVDVTDAAGQVTHYTYTSTLKQLETVTKAAGTANAQTTSYGYGDGTAGKPIGYVTSTTGPAVNGGSAITTFRYDSANRVERITNSPDEYEVTIDYDALDRPTTITYNPGTPNATTEEFAYTDPVRGMTLDLTQSIDRLGHVTKRHYNSDRNMDSITEGFGTPDARTTSYEWCVCGSLDKITDPNLHETIFNRDLQGRVYQKVFHDGMTIDYLYEGQGTVPQSEGKTSRLAASIDALGRWTRYSYYNDDNVSDVRYTDAGENQLVPPTPTVHYSYDPNYNRIEGIANAVASIDYEYYQIEAAAGLNAGRLHTVHESIANETISYTYDELGRIHSRAINGVTETITHDAMDRVTATENCTGSAGMS